MITMGLCGLWHGAGWTYVVWGLWHGLGLAVCHAWQTTRVADAEARRLVRHHAVRARGLGDFSCRQFYGCRFDPDLACGRRRVAGALQEIKLLIAAALVSALIPSAHEIIDGLKVPYPALAVGAAALAVFCLLEVGEGAPVNSFTFSFRAAHAPKRSKAAHERNCPIGADSFRCFLLLSSALIVGTYFFILLVDPYGVNAVLVADRSRRSSASASASCIRRLSAASVSIR